MHRICLVAAVLTASSAAALTARPAAAGEAVATSEGVLETHGVRARKALAEGRCADAAADAAAVTLAHPDLPLGWRLAGDAARCAGDRNLEAVRAYRRYEELGGSDFQVLQALEALSITLGRIRVDVTPHEGITDVAVWARFGDDRTVRGQVEDDGSLLIRDLPPGQPIEVGAAGLGMRTTTAQVERLIAGTVTDLSIVPDYAGRAGVRIVEELPGDVAVTLLCDHGPRPMAAGEEVLVTAGTLRARIAGPQGTTEVELYLDVDEVRTFNPLTHLAAELTIVGLPAGSEVRVFIESSMGGDVLQTLHVPAGEGDFDDATGVLLAPPQRIGGLQGGAGGLFVSHPSLGGGTGTVALVGGEVNATTFDWRTMDGLPIVQARYDAWQTARADALRPRARNVILGAAGGALLVTGAILAGQAAREASLIEPARAAADLDEFERAKAARNGFGVGSGITLGLGAASLTFTFVGEAKVRRDLKRVGTWDPETTE